MLTLPATPQEHTTQRRGEKRRQPAVRTDGLIADGVLIQHMLHKQHISISNAVEHTHDTATYNLQCTLLLLAINIKAEALLPHRILLSILMSLR